MKAVTELFHEKFYRDRVVQLYKGGPFQKLMGHWESGKLHLWRWSTLVKSCTALHKREGPLLAEWNLQKFLTAGKQMDLETGHVEHHDPTSADVQSDCKRYSVADESIRSPFFWAYVKFIILVHGMLSDQSTWAEGCACHGFKKHDCILKGRMAHLCASGAFMAFIHETVVNTAALVMYASQISSVMMSVP